MQLDLIKEAAKKNDAIEDLKGLAKELSSAYAGYDNDVFRNQAKHKAEIERLGREIAKHHDEHFGRDE